ncbi:MAG TPA: EAL domain-containing protein [Thermoanaerobaculia bacterium]|nr:EAL domain-containing protein [Thermoanaerobaculia bacterium]
MTTTGIPDDLVRFLAERSADVYWMTDDAGMLTHVAPQVEGLVGRQAGDLIGSPLDSLVHEEDASEAAALQRAILERARTCTVSYRLRRPSGEPVWVEATIYRVQTDEGRLKGFAGSWRDVTERRRIEEAYEHQAYHDTLTGLPNRRLFEDRLTIALAQARRQTTQLALLYVDVDRLNRINDTLGHPTGDEVLRIIGNRLASCVRASDTFARLGADDFILLLNNLRLAEDTVRVAQLLLDKFQEPFAVRGRELFVTASIGIAIYPQDGAEVSDLLASADAAQHTCKRLGGNGWHMHNSSINERAVQRLAVEMDLHRALERSEFFVRYQPLLEVAGEQITAVEALVRWQHPLKGELAPASFLDLAEETGLIVPIGEQVIHSACAQAREWVAAGWENPIVCVNLSARQFEHPGLLDMIDHAVLQHRVPCSMLQFEITEGTALRDLSRSIELLGELRRRGVQVSIDDFGIGYSSLAYLKQLPVNALKIDKAFLTGIPGTSDSAIVAAVIAMGHALGLTVIAEGVETTEQMAFLRQYECDVCQGYLFSRPTTPGEIIRMHRR